MFIAQVSVQALKSVHQPLSGDILLLRICAMVAHLILLILGSKGNGSRCLLLESGWIASHSAELTSPLCALSILNLEASHTIRNDAVTVREPPPVSPFSSFAPGKSGRSVRSEFSGVPSSGVL